MIPVTGAAETVLKACAYVAIYTCKFQPAVFTTTVVAYFQTRSEITVFNYFFD